MIFQHIWERLTASWVTDKTQDTRRKIQDAQDAARYSILLVLGFLQDARCRKIQNLWHFARCKIHRARRGPRRKMPHTRFRVQVFKTQDVRYRVQGLGMQAETCNIRGSGFRDARRKIQGLGMQVSRCKIQGLGLRDARRKMLRDAAFGILRRSGTIPMVLRSWRDSIVFMLTSHRQSCLCFEIKLFVCNGNQNHQF